MLAANCSNSVFGFFDTWQFQALLSHSLTCLTFPFNVFGGYCILKKTPKRLKVAKWYLMNLHCWTVATDILVGAFLSPYMFFPVFVGIPTGIFQFLGLNPAIQTFFGQLAIGGLATSILMIFENRHHTLVRGKFKLENDWIRYTFYGLNGIYSVLFLLPFYFDIPDPTVAKIRFLEILPCPHPDYFLDSVFVFSADISTVTLSAATYLCIILSECFIMSIHCAYYLISLNKHMSKSTKILQRKFFLDMIWQISVPMGALVLPMGYCFYSIVTAYYNQMLNNITICLITLHGMWSTMVLIYLNPPYRNFLSQLFHCKAKEPPRRNSASVSVSPFSLSPVA